MAQFDIIGAKAAGATDTDIADFLGKQANYDTAAARKAGATDQQIIGFLAKDFETGTTEKPRSKQAIAETTVTDQEAADEARADFIREQSGNTSREKDAFIRGGQYVHFGDTSGDTMGIASPSDKRASEQARVWVENDIPNYVTTAGARGIAGVEQSIGGAIRHLGEYDGRSGIGGQMARDAVARRNDPELERKWQAEIDADRERNQPLVDLGTNLGDEGRAVMDEVQKDKPMLSRPGKIMASTGDSVMANLPGMAATMLTGNPALGLSLMGVQSFGQVYDEARSKGLGIDEATESAAIQGGTEVATELLPFVSIAKLLKTKNFSKELLKEYLSDIPGEHIATAVQNATGKAYDHPGQEGQRLQAAVDYLTSAQHAQDQVDTFFTTILQSAVMGGVAKTIRAGATAYQNAGSDPITGGVDFAAPNTPPLNPYRAPGRIEKLQNIMAQDTPQDAAQRLAARQQPEQAAPAEPAPDAPVDWGQYGVEFDDAGDPIEQPATPPATPPAGADAAAPAGPASPGPLERAAAQVDQAQLDNAVATEQAAAQQGEAQQVNPILDESQRAAEQVRYDKANERATASNSTLAKAAQAAFEAGDMDIDQFESVLNNADKIDAHEQEKARKAGTERGGRNLFTPEELAAFDQHGVDVSGVTAQYKGEALQQLAFQQEQAAKLASPDYNAQVQAEYDRQEQARKGTDKKRAPGPEAIHKKLGENEAFVTAHLPGADLEPFQRARDLTDKISAFGKGMNTQSKADQDTWNDLGNQHRTALDEVDALVEQAKEARRNAPTLNKVQQARKRFLEDRMQHYTLSEKERREAEKLGLDVPPPKRPRGEIGMKLGAGEVVLTASGRETSPFPKVDVTTNGKAANTLKRADQWLMQNALDEAEARGDDFNATQFRANLEKPQQADKDSAEQYLFGEKQPPVVPKATKPFVPATPEGRRKVIEAMIERHGGVDNIPPAWREEWRKLNGEGTGKVGLPKEVREAAEKAGVDPSEIHIISTPEERKEFVRKYGVPNVVDEGNGVFGKFGGALFVDDETGKPVAYAPEALQPAGGQPITQGRMATESTAPEHANVGATDEELGQIVDEFNAAHKAMYEDNEAVHHLFDPPAKTDVVRLQEKVKVYNKDHGWMSLEEARAKIQAWKDHAASQGKNPKGNGDKVVLSLFDLSGQWSQPWVDAGYQVYRFDIQDDPEVGDVHKFSTEHFAEWFSDFEGMDIYAILAATPCTDFAVSGARHFAAKDADGRTVSSVKLVHQTLATIEHFKPMVWAIENPVGRIEKLGGLPPWRLSFDPNHLGDPYTKKTLLWGRFNADLPVAPVEPTEGSKMHAKFGGKSLATKNARSVTPEGFAYAFFMANNAQDHPVMAVANKYDRLDRAVISKALDAGITPAEIDSIVEDHYYMDLDDEAANKALQEAIDKKTPPAAPKPPPPPAKKNGKPRVNPTKDSILTAISKLGGMDIAAATGQWGQSVKDDLKAMNAVVRQETGRFGHVFHKGGLPLDDMRVRLSDYGYLPEDGSLADLEDAVMAAARGEVRGSIAKDLDSQIEAEAQEWQQRFEPTDEDLDAISYQEFTEQEQAAFDLYYADLIDSLIGEVYSEGETLTEADFIARADEATNSLWEGLNEGEDQGRAGETATGKQEEGASRSSKNGSEKAQGDQGQSEIPSLDDFERMLDEAAGTSKPATDAEIQAEALRWQGARIHAEKVFLDKGDKKGAFQIAKTGGKSMQDTYLMGKFGIDRARAHDISNRITSENLEPDLSATIEQYKGENWADTALAAQQAERGAERVTRDKHPGNGSVVVDAKGTEYLVMSARNSIVNVAPIINGKATVNKDTTISFNVDPTFKPASDSTRTEPLYTTGRNYYAENEAGKKAPRYEQTAAGDQGVLLTGARALGKGKNAKEKGQAGLDDMALFTEPKERQAEKDQGDLFGGKPATMQDHIKAAVEAGADAVGEILKGITNPNKLGSGPVFDDEAYQKMKPHLARMWREIRAAGFSFKEAAQAFAKQLIDTFGAAIKPFALKYYGELAETERNGGENVERSSSDMERDSADAETQDIMGQEDVQPRPRGDERRTLQDVADSSQEAFAAGRDSLLPRLEAPATGEQGDNGVHSHEAGTRAARGAAGSEHGERGGDTRNDGPLAESVSAKAVEQAVERSDSGSLNHEDDVDRDLPELQPGQREDVRFAERRFSKQGGHGVLFTNGTGTGKTYTGLGIIKRFVNRGQDNGIIVAPNDNIINSWISTGRRLGLTIQRLEDTKDNGKNGVVVTTYANFGQNPELVNRSWDFIIGDEAHNFSSNKDGNASLASKMMDTLTLHPRGVYQRAELLNPKLMQQIAAAKSDYDQAVKEGRDPQPAKRKLENLWQQFQAAQDKVKAEVNAAQDSRPKVVFLSATPFAYEKSIEYAEGYLFSYGPEVNSGAYNSGDARSRFFMQHFGYRMRYNKLTEPPAEVDRGVMQRQFNTFLKKEGVLSARVLDVNSDYDRKFVLVDSAVGNKIDEGLELLRDNPRYRPIYEAVMEKFDHLSRRYLLEAIKAKEVIPHIKAHRALGRQVVIFHDFNKGGGFNPFHVSHLLSNDGQFSYYPKDGGMKQVTASVAQVTGEFLAERPDLQKLPLDKLNSPLVTLKAAFPDILVINGTEKKKDRQAAIERFQSDDDPAGIVIVQSAAGEAGISLHDTTGKAPRVLFNLGLPTRPQTSIQQEGRIYRIGQASDAMFRYMNTGTSWERYAFATTIANRTSAAENLALGESARAMRDAFIEAFQESGSYPAGFEGEGKGGKERDRAANMALSEWDRAISFYFGQRKGRQNDLGADYFATPEPLGLKMVEWAGIRTGDAVLEPSLGHGAIGRWFPEDVKRRGIEPSLELASRAALVFDGDIVQGRFEDHNIVNKYDAIVMNPPFGSGGKTAVDHLAKAAKHLKEHGRIVAIIPTGPAADKKFDKWLYEEEVRAVEPIGKLHGTDVYKGDTANYVPPPLERKRMGLVENRVPVTITNAMDNQGFFIKIRKTGQQFAVPSAYLVDLEPMGKRETRAANDMQLRASYNLPRVTFERAGTSVAARVVVLDKGSDGHRATYDFNDSDSINDFFEELEHKAVPDRDRPAPVEEAEESPAKGLLSGRGAKLPSAPAPKIPTEEISAAQFNHTKTGAAIYVATVNKRLGDAEYKAAASLAKRHGGHYSSYRGAGAIPGFHFDSAEKRDAFANELRGEAGETRFSLDQNGFDEYMAAIEKQAADLRAEVSAKIDPERGGKIDLEPIGRQTKRFAIISKNLDGDVENYPWRVTMFDDAGPSGHTLHRSLDGDPGYGYNTSAVQEVAQMLPREETPFPDLSVANGRPKLDGKAVKKVEQLIAQALPEGKVTLKILDRIEPPKNAKTAQAAFSKHGVESGNIAGMHRKLTHVTTREVRSIIELSLERATEKTGYHEVMHAAEALGLITPKDLAILEREYPSKGGVASSERRADGFADYLAGKSQQAFPVKVIFAKIKAFLKRLGDLLKGNGWRTADDVFADLLGGELKRNAQGVPVQAPRVQFAAAWHGSPHDHNKFSTDNIGTGEGYHTYGYGLYFAGARAVAEHYREALSGKVPSGWADKYPEAARGYIRGMVGDVMNGVETAQRAARMIQNANANMRDYPADQLAKELEEAATFAKGRLYRVELAPKQTEYLDWDKPFAKQSEEVKKALKDAGIMKEYQRNLSDFTSDMETRGTQRRGNNIYAFLVAREGSRQAASTFLHSIGIRGIKYFDSQSRDSEKGTRNYVIFDDADVEIVEKFSLSDDVPKKTVKAYKLFRIDAKKPGQLFPLFVNANQAVPIGKWVDAEVGPLTDKGKVKSKLGPLAYRPGWHAGDLPIATHIGQGGQPPTHRPSNQVWAEIEMPADVDWQTEANRRGTNPAGKLVPVKAHITDQLPAGGHYRYKTNPNMTGNWLISGAMKINRVLTDREVKDINGAAGVADLPRVAPLDLAALGFEGESEDTSFSLSGDGAFQSSSDEVQQRRDAAHGLEKGPGLLFRLKEQLERMNKERQHFPELDRVKDARTADILRVFESSRQAATAKSVAYLKQLTKGMAPAEMTNFEWRVLLDDLMAELEKGHKLPFGYTEETLREDHARIVEITDRSETVKAALELRQRVMGEVVQDLVNADLLPESVLDNRSYFRHMVLEHANARKWAGLGNKDVRNKKRGWQKGRQGSELDINTNFLEAEFEVYSQQLKELATKEALEKVERLNDIGPQLKAKAKTVNFRNLVGGPDVVARIRELEGQAAEIRAGEVDSGAKKMLAEIGKALDELDPTRPYKRSMAIGFNKLERLARNGALPEGKLAGMAAALANGDPSEKLMNYVAWLAGEETEGAGPARQILKAVSDLDKLYREVLGDEYLEHRRMIDSRLIPEGYTEWQPEKGNVFFRQTTLPEQIVDKAIAATWSIEELVNSGLLKEAIVMGGRKRSLILPEGVANTLENLRLERDTAVLDTINKKLLGAWKIWTLLSPRRVIKYNLNNMSGDMDAAVAADPMILKYLGEAWQGAKRRRKGTLTAEDRDMLDRGVIDSGISINEIPDINQLPLFKNLTDEQRDKKLLDAIKTGDLSALAPNVLVAKYFDKISGLTNIREALLREAAYRRALELLQAGKPVMWASKPYEINAIPDLKDKAAKLARELLGDYGNISAHGETIRARFLPFWSWMEINTPRYYRIFKNAAQNGGKFSAGARITGVAGKKFIGTTAGVVEKVILTQMLFALVSAFNFLMHGGDNDDLDRRQLHLNLGKDSNGNILSVRFQGAFSDALSWFGLEDYPEVIRKMNDGSMDATDLAKKMLWATPNKIVNAAIPFAKLGFEELSGKTFYPDINRPRPIRDKAEHAARFLSLENEYRTVAGKPSKGYGDSLKGLLLYTTDPGEQAYNTVRGMAAEWQQKHGKEITGGEPTARSNALYYYKQALRYGDKEAADRYMQKYKELGGTTDGLETSIRRAAPLASLKVNERIKFRHSLSEAETKTLDKALKWYKEVYQR